IEITVADSGMGIKTEDIPKLFHAFTQLESVYTKQYEGTGLGLALTRQLVELHGGRIWVKSEFGKGSSFSFTIPLTQPDFRDSLSNRPDAVPPKSSTVLLIENEPLTLSSLENGLQNNGYRVLRASNGADGIAIARSDSPDLIVLDLIMPNMNGFDVADQLRNDNTTAKIPILVMTAMDLSAADRARLSGNVWMIAEKGTLSTNEFTSLVERGITRRKSDA